MDFASEVTKSMSDNAVMPVEQTDAMRLLTDKIEKKLKRLSEDQGKSVACVAITCGSELLMGQRRDNDKWTVPGGHLNAGEDPHVGACRELYEESGVRAKKLKHLNTTRIDSDPSRPPLTIHSYQLEVPHRVHPHALNDPDNEIKKWSWVTLNEVPQLDLHVPLKDNILLQKIGVKA